VREIPTFKPERELLVRVDDLHAWVESRPAHAADAASTDPLAYESFAAGVRRSRIAG
jgi:hypothetical protein